MATNFRDLVLQDERSGTDEMTIQPPGNVAPKRMTVAAMVAGCWIGSSSKRSGPRRPCKASSTGTTPGGR